MSWPLLFPLNPSVVCLSQSWTTKFGPWPSCCSKPFLVPIALSTDHPSAWHSPFACLCQPQEWWETGREVRGDRRPMHKGEGGQENHSFLRPVSNRPHQLSFECSDVGLFCDHFFWGTSSSKWVCLPSELNQTVMQKLSLRRSYKAPRCKDVLSAK